MDHGHNPPRALTPWVASDPIQTTFQKSYSQEELVSPLREKGTYPPPSMTTTYRKSSKVFEQTGMMIGQQLNEDRPILKKDAQAAWKEQVSNFFLGNHLDD